MCGIVGYIGNKEATDVVLAGLQGLEYRGYDSAGLAAISSGEPKLIKQVGRVDGLVKAVAEAHVMSDVAVGHTRWATHGSPTVANAHPHCNTEGTIYVVHNGIIENYGELRDRLQKEGYMFASETDTETVPHLIDFYRKQLGSFEEAFRAALADLRGAYAIAAVTSEHPDTLFAARLSSPLVIGVGKDEYILASDPSALMTHTKEVIFLNDYEIATIARDGLSIHNSQEMQPVEPKSELLDYDAETAALGDFPNFMLKEIYEAPATVRSATLGRINIEQKLVKLGGLENVVGQLKYIDRIVIVACGTSYYAGLVGEYLIEEIAGIPVEVQLASEFKYRNEPFSRSTALLAISQSGETADTIAALKKVEDYGCLRLGVVNAVGSTIARMTDAGVYCHAGPEQAVASTKAFMAQVTVLALIALHLSDGASPMYQPLLRELDSLPGMIEKLLEDTVAVEAAANKYKDYRDFLFIGRRYSFPCAMEGALKLKEVSYIHAEGYAAGEMKHGPLAMIDENFPTFALATDGELLEKTYSNIEEIRARKGPVLAVATKGNAAIGELADDVLFIPEASEAVQPLLIAVVMQLFSYHVATAKGLDVDRPRNLAKSVTVE